MNIQIAGINTATKQCFRKENQKSLIVANAIDDFSYKWAFYTITERQMTQVFWHANNDGSC